MDIVDFFFLYLDVYFGSFGSFFLSFFIFSSLFIGSIFVVGKRWKVFVNLVNEVSWRNFIVDI